MPSREGAAASSFFGSRNLRAKGKPISRGGKIRRPRTPCRSFLSATRAENFYLHARGKLRARMPPRERGIARASAEGRYRADLFSLAGELVKVPDEALRAVLKAMGIAAGDDDEIAASLTTVAPISLDRTLGTRRRSLLHPRLAEERPILGHRLPALFAALSAQLGDRRFRGSRATCRDRRGGRRGFRRRQSAARTVSGRAGAMQAPSLRRTARS